MSVSPGGWKAWTGESNQLFLLRVRFDGQLPARAPKRALAIGLIEKLNHTDSVPPAPISEALPPLAQGTEPQYAARVVPVGATAATGTKVKPTRPGPST